MVSTRSRGKPSDDTEEVDRKEEIKLEDDDVLIIDEQAEVDSDPHTEAQPKMPKESRQTSKDTTKGFDVDKDTSSDDSSVLDYPEEDAVSDVVEKPVSSVSAEEVNKDYPEEDAVSDVVEKPVSSVSAEEVKKAPAVNDEPIVDVDMEAEELTAKPVESDEVKPVKMSPKKTQVSAKKDMVQLKKADVTPKKSSKKEVKPAKEVQPIKRKMEERKTAIKESKKVKKEEQIDNYEDESDDDAPVEVSSKKVVAPDIVLKESKEPEMSLFEQVQAKKQELANRKAGIKEKEKERKIKRKQLRQGEFLVKTKQSQFKVITLNKGLSKKLEPERNFKAELLASRTADRRVKDVKATLHRAKWGGKFDTC